MFFDFINKLTGYGVWMNFIIVLRINLTNKVLVNFRSNVRGSSIDKIFTLCINIIVCSEIVQP